MNNYENTIARLFTYRTTAVWCTHWRSQTQQSLNKCYINLRKFFARQTFEHQIFARRTSARQCCHCRPRTPTETVFIISTYIYKVCFIVIRCIIGAYREYSLVREWNKLVRPRVAATTKWLHLVLFDTFRFVSVNCAHCVTFIIITLTYYIYVN